LTNFQYHIIEKKNTPLIKAGTNYSSCTHQKCRKIEIMVIEKRKYTKKKKNWSSRAKDHLNE
jgi:hypothetical protein